VTHESVLACKDSAVLLHGDGKGSYEYIKHDIFPENARKSE
jgi:hypothetical protein